MLRENQGPTIAMSSYYDPEKMRLQGAIRRGKRLLAEDQFNTTTDKEAHKAELEGKEEELRKLDTKMRMEYNVIWSTYDMLWPVVHNVPTTTSSRSG